MAIEDPHSIKGLAILHPHTRCQNNGPTSKELTINSIVGSMTGKLDPIINGLGFHMLHVGDFQKQMTHLPFPLNYMCRMAEARQPLWRKVPFPSSKINPYRIVIIFRLVVLVFFFRFRITTPAMDAYPLWLVSIICEIWFALSWILDQFPKWFPINRETYLDRLSMRFEREGEPNRLSHVDVFVSTVDPLKEPPIITANTVLSILAIDYPVDKVSCYVSDDGASMLLFDTLSETAEFARRWVPFCKKHNVEPRAPEFYFSEKIDYLKDKVQPTFVKERRAMKVSCFLFWIHLMI